MDQLFYSFNTYLKQKHNKKVYKICIDAGFTCPNRNGSKGYGGCIYCNNDAFTIIKRNIINKNNNEKYVLPSIEEQIKDGKKKLISQYKDQAFFIYF